MLSIAEINKRYKDASEVLGFNPSEIKQGSDEWLHMKLGVISASNASKIINPKTQTYESYMHDLIAQVLTAEQHNISSKSMEWGNMHEDAARAMYEFELDKQIIEYPFIYKNKDMRAGCSPDGLMGKLGCEIKCPYTSKVHVDMAVAAKVKKEYEHQVQFSMWVTDADVWHFCSYDPRAKKKPLVVKVIERNEVFMDLYDVAVPEFVKRMNEKLEILDIEWGFQWQK